VLVRINTVVSLVHSLDQSSVHQIIGRVAQNEPLDVLDPVFTREFWIGFEGYWLVGEVKFKTERLSWVYRVFNWAELAYRLICSGIRNLVMGLICY